MRLLGGVLVKITLPNVNLDEDISVGGTNLQICLMRQHMIIWIIAKSRNEVVFVISTVLKRILHETRNLTNLNIHRTLGEVREVNLQLV